MNEFFIYNDLHYPLGTPVIPPTNRSFRYGDGVFETMKMVNGHLVNETYHFQRLFHGLELLHFAPPAGFDAAFLAARIRELVFGNGQETSARIRLTVFRGDGGLFDLSDLTPHYLIESSTLPGNTFQEDGLSIDLFPGGEKSCDRFSNLKSNNYLLPVMAALHARSHGLQECLILNGQGRICESATSNVFLVTGREILTPPLEDGCVAGVMRRWLLERLELPGYRLREKSLVPADLDGADELFLTNAITCLRWVKTFRQKKYVNTLARQIYERAVAAR